MVTGDAIFVLALALIPLGMTIGMFASKQVMMGFPCAIFWAIFGGYCYTQSAATWDIFYLLFFGSFGMVIFTMFAAYGLRTKKEDAQEGDSYIDEGKDDLSYIGDGKEEGEGEPSKRRAGVRARAEQRRSH